MYKNISNIRRYIQYQAGYFSMDIGYRISENNIIPNLVILPNPVYP